MKKYLSLFISFILILGLASCTPEGQEQTGGGAGLAQIVCNTDADAQLAAKLRDGLYQRYQSFAKVVNDSAPVQNKEIIVGKSEREGSVKAYGLLSRIDKESDAQTSYLLYSDGTSLVLAYEEDAYGLNAAGLKAVSAFLEDMLSDYIDSPLKTGVITYGVIDPIAYQRSLDEKEREESWIKLANVAGKEVAEATKSYYAMFSPRLVSWMADLYDPETGGFYFSNSGRNTEGYLPDIEATYDILSMLENSGMITHLGGKYNYLPEEFLEKMGMWVKGMQDPCGYFYHPQWGKDLTDTKPNRRGRDLSYGMAIVQAAGLNPTYNTPSGYTGDYTLPDGTKVDKYGNPVSKSLLTGRLSDKNVNFASLIKSTASSVDLYSSPQLKDAATFEAYLYSLDLKNDSYVVGNRLSNQVAEIKQRDEELDGALVRILERWLKEFQNPKNGMWEWRSEDDPTYSDYDGVNGILKLLTLFNFLGIEYPNPIPASESIIKAIYTDDANGGVCHAYNAWYALEDLFENLIEHSKNLSETHATIQAIRERLRADAPELIAKTAEKVKIFIKDDSSSSFAPYESSSTSQGMRVAVPHTDEGDTNATLINTFGVLNHMFDVFGWQRPDMYGKADYYYFMYLIDNQTEVIKDKEPDPVPLDFDYDTPGQSMPGMNTEFCLSEGKRMVIKDPTDSKKGNVYQFESVAGAHDVIYIPCDSLSLTASCYIFESDYYVSTDMTGYFSKILLDANYFIGMYVQEDGTIRFIDSSNSNSQRYEQDLGFSARLEEWFKLRIEYYVGDNESVRIKIYFNGECVAVSDNYYDAGNYGTPVPFYVQAKVEVFSASQMTILLDNVLTHKSNAVYKEELDPERKMTVNVDAPDRSEVIFDFEDTSLGEKSPYGFGVTDPDGAVSVVESEGGKALGLNGASGFTLDVMPMNRRTKEANAYVFEADINIKSFANDARVEIMLRDSGVMNTAIMRVWLIAVTEGDETYVALYEAAAGILGKRLADIKLPIGDTAKLTVQYYEDTGAYLVYIDGKLLAFSSAIEAYAKRAGVGKAQIINLTDKDGAAGAVNMTLDNVKLEKIESSFDNEVKPERESVTHGFESGLPEGVTLSGGEIKGEENKLLALSSGGILTVPVNKRSVASGAFVLNITVNVPKGAKDGDSVRLLVTDKGGNAIIAYDLRVLDGTVRMYEVTAKASYSPHIASFALGADITLGIEYYRQRDVAHIFIGDVCSAVTSITYSQGSGELDAESLVIEAKCEGVEITFDDIVFESYNKFFVYRTAKGANSETSAEKITFESSTTGNLPARFTTDLRTSSAAVRVKEMVRGGKASKVLAFESSAGANDKLSFSMYAPDLSRTTTVFECEMYLDYTNLDTTTYEIYLTNSSSTHSYMMLMSMTDGALTFGDLTGASASAVPGRIFGKQVSLDNVNEGEWFTLRMEYYEGDHDTVRIKTYVNGTLVYVSCAYYGRSSTVYGTQPKGKPDRLLISSYGALVGTMYLDDMSIKGDKLVNKSDALTYIPKEAEPNLPNDEDTAELITFESSVTGNIPDAITKELKSLDGAIAIEELTRLGVKSKVMTFTTSSDSGDQLFIARTKSTDGYNALEFSAKIAFRDIKSQGATYYIYFREGTQRLNRIVLSIASDGTISISDYYNKVFSISTEQGKTGLYASDWHEFKMTLYSYEGSCRLRISLGGYSIVSTNSSWDALTPDRVTDLLIESATTSALTVMLDDVSLQQKIIEIPKEHTHVISDTLTYDGEYHWYGALCSDGEECEAIQRDKAPHFLDECGLCECGYKKPKSDKLGYFENLGGYDFTGMTAVSSSLESPLIIKRNMSCSSTANQITHATYTAAYLNFGAEDENTFLTLGVGGAVKNNWISGGKPGFACYIPAGVGDCYVFESSVRFGPNNNITDTYGALSISFVDADGGEHALQKVVSSLVKSADERLYNCFGTEIDAGVWINVGVEYYAEEGIAKYYLNGELMHTQTVEKTEAQMSYVRVFMEQYGDQYVSFDDMFFGKVGKHLAESDGYYTFNDGALPDSVTSQLNSTGSLLTVSDAPCLNTTEKALTLISNSDAYDLVFFGVQDKADAESVVFETKYLVKGGSANFNKLEFMSSSNKILGIVQIYVTADGELQISDNYDDGNAETANWSFSTVKINLGSAKWVSLKLVAHENAEGRFVTDIYANGSLVATSTHSAWAESSVSDISAVRYQATNKFSGTVYFDDTRVTKE